MFCQLRIFLLISLFSLSLISSPIALAAITVNDTGLDNSANAATLKTDTTLPKMIGLVIRGALGIVGAIFLILIVYGGFLWMISEGDNTKVSAARGYIFHSILGLVITLSAYALTDVVISIFTGTNGAVQ